MMKDIIKNWLTDSKFLMISSMYICIITTALLFVGFNKEEKTINNNINYIEKLILIGNNKDINLNTKNALIYNKDDVRTKSNVTEEELTKMLKGTKMEELVPYLVATEDNYGINVIVLTSIIANNSNWNTSERSEKYNNVSHLGDKNGLKFNSKEECIDFTAKLLSEEYLQEEGTYFKGYSLKDISINFCNSDIWVNNINNIIYNLLYTLY